MPAVHRLPGRRSSMERLPPAFPNPADVGPSGDGRGHLGECRRASPLSWTVPRHAGRGGHSHGGLLHGRARVRDRGPGYPRVRPALRGQHRRRGPAMSSVSAQTLLLRSVPADQRGRASGLFSGGFLVGSISGPAIGGLLAAWSLRAPFFVYGGMLVVPAVIAAVVLRDPARRDQGRDGPRAASPFAGVGRALRSRAFRAAASANLADGFAAVGVRSAIVPLFVRDVLHRSAVWTGIGFLVVAVLNAAALLPAGWAADRLGRRPGIVAGCSGSAAGPVMLAVLPGLWGYLTALAVLGLGSGLLDVAPAAMIGDLLGGQGGQGGTVVATYQMAGDAGTVAGPVTAGYLVDTISYGAAFGLAAGVLGVAAVLGFFAPETRSPGPAAVPEAAHTDRN